MAAVSIKVPAVSESISEGILARWLKPDGAAVKADEPLYELETDKASQVFNAPAAGVLKIKAAEGDTVAVGAEVGTIDPAGQATAAAAPAKPAPAPARPPPRRRSPRSPRPPPSRPGTATPARPTEGSRRCPSPRPSAGSSPRTTSTPPGSRGPAGAVA